MYQIETGLRFPVSQCTCFITPQACAKARPLSISLLEAVQRLKLSFFFFYSLSFLISP